MKIPKLTLQQTSRKWVQEASREPTKISFEHRFWSEAKCTIKMVIRNQNRLNQDKTSYDIIFVTGIVTIAVPDLNDTILLV